MLNAAFQDRADDVILDLSGVRHLDTVAVAVIAISSDRMRESGRQLVVQGLNRRQQRSMRRKGMLIPAPRSSQSDQAEVRRRSSAA
jgi:anti-anti-sigma regulatory factor